MTRKYTIEINTPNRSGIDEVIKRHARWLYEELQSYEWEADEPSVQHTQLANDTKKLPATKVKPKRSRKVGINGRTNT